MNKDVHLIGEAYKNQILEASKSELRIPHIKQKVLNDIESNFMRQVLANKIHADSIDAPDQKTRKYARDFITLANKLKNETNNREIWQILDTMKDISDYIGLHLKIPQLPGRYTHSSGMQSYQSRQIPNQDKRNFERSFSPEP